MGSLETSRSVRAEKEESIALLPRRVGEAHVVGVLHGMFAQVIQSSAGFVSLTESDRLGLDWSLNWLLIVATFSVKKEAKLSAERFETEVEAG